MPNLDEMLKNTQPTIIPRRSDKTVSKTVKMESSVFSSQTKKK